MVKFKNTGNYRMNLFNKLKQTLTGNQNNQSPTTSPPRRYSPEEEYVMIIEAERAEKDSFFRFNPYSPIPIEDRQNFKGLNYYPPTLDFRFTLPLQRTPKEAITFQTSTDDKRVYHRLGTVKFTIDNQTAELTIYHAEESEEALFLPFRDANSGQETYGGGRYLEPTLTSDDQIDFDFNLAYNPFCAYSDQYSCPLPPIENWLKIPIFAGEKNYQK